METQLIKVFLRETLKNGQIYSKLGLLGLGCAYTMNKTGCNNRTRVRKNAQIASH